MGSSGWHNFTPWRDDPVQALAEAKRAVFKAGTYANKVREPAQRLATLRAEVATLQARGDEISLIAASDLVQIADALDRLLNATTIDERIAATVAATHTEGTHSILDIGSVGVKPAWLVATPLSKRVIRAVIGTDLPSREQLEPEVSEWSQAISRGSARYATAYDEHGAPSEYLFFGITGD